MPLSVQSFDCLLLELNARDNTRQVRFGMANSPELLPVWQEPKGASSCLWSGSLEAGLGLICFGSYIIWCLRMEC